MVRIGKRQRPLNQIFLHPFYRNRATATCPRRRDVIESLVSASIHGWEMLLRKCEVRFRNCEVQIRRWEVITSQGWSKGWSALRTSVIIFASAYSDNAKLDMRNSDCLMWMRSWKHFHIRIHFTSHSHFTCQLTIAQYCTYVQLFAASRRVIIPCTKTHPTRRPSGSLLSKFQNMLPKGHSMSYKKLKTHIHCAFVIFDKNWKS